MGKKLIILGADFSQNAVNKRTQLDFSTLSVRNISIAVNTDLNRIDAVGTSGTPAKPAFYEVDLANYEEDYLQLELNTSIDGLQRVLFTNDIIPTIQVGVQIGLTDLLPASADDSYYAVIPANSNVVLDIPNGTRYIYIRKYSSTADWTPASAILNL